MSDGNRWLDDVLESRLGGKKEWTDTERVELSHQLDRDMEKRFEKLISKKEDPNYKSERKEDAWTEENWKEKMAEHPIFTPYLHEGEEDAEAPDNGLSDGLAQLKFSPEHNNPSELATNYKDEGNYHFARSKYKLAVANYSEGLQAKCTDSQLQAQLLNNRAAAYYHMGNYRAAIRDCALAVQMKPDYRKAFLCAANSADRLGAWDELLEWADRGLKLKPHDTKFLNLRDAAVDEKTKNDRIMRKKSQELDRKLKDARKLLATITNKGIAIDDTPTNETVAVDEDDVVAQLENQLRALPSLEPSYENAKGSKVYENKTSALVWPVMLMYPEYNQSDFIQHFNENHTFLDQLSVVFGDGCPPAPWDSKHRYTLSRIAIFYKNTTTDRYVQVQLNDTLQSILTDKRHKVHQGCPSFFIAVGGSPFAKTYFAGHD